MLTLNYTSQLHCYVMRLSIRTIPIIEIESR